VSPTAKPVKQKICCFALDKRDVIKKEITWLLYIGFIGEFLHHEWVPSHILVQKKNTQWTLCVDYTDLNKAFLKYLLGPSSSEGPQKHGLTIGHQYICQALQEL
jgi:hypothetical protein